jgi:phosphorylase/glycogen(starch) synthase
LLNSSENRVKVFFYPCYLDGNDGFVNMTYYELLAGLDLSVFPSYYEPWGYTPLESLAFRVPTVTTSLAGFGLWVDKQYKEAHPGIEIIHRDDRNRNSVVTAIAEVIERVSGYDTAQTDAVKANARDVSSIALWDHFLTYYTSAYAIALGKIVQDLAKFPVRRDECFFIRHDHWRSAPSWFPVTIQKQLPYRLIFLDILSKNLWWSWNEEAIDLFAGIDPDAVAQSREESYYSAGYDPAQKIQSPEKNTAFLARLDAVEDRFEGIHEAKESMTEPRIAYFSMEYGLDWSLKFIQEGWAYWPAIT